MRTSLCAVLLVLWAGAAFAHSTCEEDIQQELERERKEDADSHGCRDCGKIDLEAAPNCPAKGYDCDESLQVTSSVISVGSCECAQLRCAADNATLAVDGELVKKLTCKEHKWTSDSGEAESTVCARECGARICPVSPITDPSQEILFAPLAVQPPDEEHRCAWADCQYGAVVTSPPDANTHIFKGPASFACAGNRMWSYTGPQAEIPDLLVAYCVKNECKSLQYSDDNPLCKTKYACSEPSYVDMDNDERWGEMTCPNGGKIQFTANNTITYPTCMLGLWFASPVGLISPETQVMCVNCIGIKTDTSDAQQPIVTEGEVKCNEGLQLIIEYGTGADKRETAVDSMACSSNDIKWETTGGSFDPYGSLDDVISQGKEWKVRCVPEGSVCKTLPFGDKSTLCDTTYSCYKATFGYADDGTKQMSCRDPNALQIDTDEQYKKATVTCEAGQWKNLGSPIASNTEVRCIDCKLNIEKTENGDPELNSETKFVECKSGGVLSISFEKGTTKGETQVRSMMCTLAFLWGVSGGNFAPFEHFDDAVNQGATWKAKCA